MKVTVVIAAEAPGCHLPLLLSALRQQSHRPFEVVLVMKSLGACVPEAVKVVACPQWNPARAKNLGAVHAAGEVVVFLEPCAIPDASWLTEVVRGYTSDHVAGVGGPIVHGDKEPGYTADRLGNRVEPVAPPYWAYQIPLADRFVCLHAGNCSFRRSCFLEAGGFDEKIGDELCQTDLCLRLTDRGYILQPSPRPVVQAVQLYESPASRPHQGGRLVPELLRNQVHFAVRSANPLTGRHDVMRHFAADGDEQDRAVWEGIAHAVCDRKPEARRDTPSPFLPYPGVDPPYRRLTLGFTTRTFPPTSGDPHGRSIWNQARGLAECGHEIHLFTTGREGADYEQGVWVHGSAEGGTIHRAVKELAQTRPIDLLVTGLGEGVDCLLDRTLHCALDLEPTLKMRVGNPPGAAPPELEPALRLEQLLLRSARRVIAASPGLLRSMRQLHAAPFVPAQIRVCPPAVRDRRAAFSPRPSVVPRVLFVGALDRVHGADLFLEASINLIREGLNIEALVAGDADTPSDVGPSYRALVGREGAAVRRRIRFVGELSEDGLSQALADCDAVCLPYRVEAAVVPCLEALSFGRPVVAADLDSTGEILGDCGLLFRPGDAAALTDRLRPLLADAELRERLGRLGRRVYECRFAFGRALKITLEAYTQFVETAAAPRGDVA